MKIIRNLMIAFIAVFYLLPFLMYLETDTEESTGYNDYVKITDVDYKAVVLDGEHTGGKVLITEKLTFDIHAASRSNLFWELWRDLPEDEVDGLKVDYDVNYVKEIKSDGTSKLYTKSNFLLWEDYDFTSNPYKWYHSKGPYNEDFRRYEALMIYPNGRYREKVTYEIQYVMNNASLRYDDVSELYLTMYSEETIKYLKSFKAEILVSDDDMPEEGNYIAHTFGTNSHTFDFNESKTINPGYHTFYFELDEKDLKFKDYNQYIEFTLLAFNEDKHSFTDYAPKNIYSDDVYLNEAKAELEKYDNLPKVYRKWKAIILCLSISISAFAGLCAHIYKIKMKNAHKYYNAHRHIEYFREIPSDLDPYFAATLVFVKDKHKANVGDSYSAIILSLVRKKYIELKKINEATDWVFHNIIINILFDNNENLEPLTYNEELYMNLILKYASGDLLPLEKFQDRISHDYDNTDSFVSRFEKSIVDIGISEKYFQKAEYDEVKKKVLSYAGEYTFVGIAIMIFGNLSLVKTRLDLAFGALFILGITFLIIAYRLKKQSGQFVLLTQYGEEEYNKWRALYNYLNSETLMNEKTVIELPLWEKYLVYATAFGIADKVVKALEVKHPDTNGSEVLNNNYYRSTHFRTSNRTFSSHARSASSISRSNHSSGSYYGGGGRGGGGGGGGH